MEKIYDIKTEGNVAVATVLNAEINLEQIEDIKDDLYKLIDEGKNIVINLSKIVFVSSIFIVVLVACLKKAKKANKEIVICNAAPEVERVLTITGMDKIFSIYDTERDAVKVLSGK